jgi:hypothetical protein
MRKPEAAASRSSCSPFDVKRQRSRKFMAVLITIAVLAFLAVCLWSTPTSRPRLSVTYLQTIDGHGNWRLQFGITNVGNSTVFTSNGGEIEVFNHTNLLSVGATSPLSRLVPGQGQVVDAVLSEAQMDLIDGKWRYTCLYAGDGLRSRNHNGQWGPGGRGARVNWLIPGPLKGMPLTVKATSDWIQPGNFRFRSTGDRSRVPKDESRFQRFECYLGRKTQGGSRCCGMALGWYE